MRQTVEDPRILWYRVLLRNLLTARHCGEPLSAENPSRSVSLTRQDMLRASELQSENSKLIGASGDDQQRALRHRAVILYQRKARISFCAG